MTAIIAKRQIYSIKLGQSKKLLDGFFVRYNQGKKLGEQLRGQHKSLSAILIYYFSQTIRKAQVFGDGVQEGKDLPVLRTNNKQLGQKLGVCEKTVRNLRKRLETAKLIIKTEFCGSNSSYKLTLSSAILHISAQRGTENRVLYFSKAHGSSDLFLAPSGKTLPHTVTSTVQDTIKLNILEGIDFKQIAGSQSVKGKIINSDEIEGGKESSQFVENQRLKAAQEQQELSTGYARSKTKSGTPPQVAPAPPAVAPDFFADVTAHLDRITEHKLEKHVMNVFHIASINLYKGRWMNAAERERAKARIAEYFAYSDKKGWTRGANEMTARIILAKKWNDRRVGKGITGWTFPIPSAYFNFRNEKGFQATKKWYKKSQQSRNEIKDQDILTTAVNWYLKSFEEGAKYDTTEAYRICNQRLSKRSKKLVQMFNEQIEGLQQTA